MTISFIVIFLLQVVFNYSRTIGTRHLAKGNVYQTLIWGQVIQITWLATTAIGVKAVWDSEWLIISSYLLGGLIGSWIAMVKTIKEN